MSAPIRQGIAASIVLLALAGASLPAARGQDPSRETASASPPGGGSANGESRNATWSQDDRAARLMAYDSSASNLVAGDSNGRRDVFVFARSGGEGSLSGKLLRASVGAGGRQANGDSQLPSLDGQVGARPHCVAFQSHATNLAKGDGSGDWDIYLRDLKRKRTLLVSAGRRDATNAAIDGECQFVAFQSRGTIWVADVTLRKKRVVVYRIARGTNPDMETDGKGVAYERGGQIRYQAFRTEFRRGFVRLGREKLVSDDRNGRPGNGTSRNPSIDDLGRYVAFESTATNLCVDRCTGVSEDRNGSVSDVFRRTISREAPTKDTMQMVSYSQGCSAASPTAKTVDQQGNGPSNNPMVTGAGENIVFDSEATNLKESSGIAAPDPNGSVRDIYYWNFPRGRRCGNVSRESRGPGSRAGGQPLNGASVDPASSNRANYIAFTSFQTGDFGESNGAGIGDVFIRFLGGK